MALPAFNAQAWGEGIEVHFEQVYQAKVQGLPIVNAQLSVRLACLKEVRQGIYLGALVTPWFLNLVLKMVEPQEDAWVDRHPQLYPGVGVGKKAVLKFPSGTYEFIVNHQEELGYFYTCSLVSDMHTLESQEAAETMAEQCVHLVFDSAAKEPNLFRPRELSETPLNESSSEAALEASQAEGDKDSRPAKKIEPSKKFSDTPHSRRDFLRLKERFARDE